MTGPAEQPDRDKFCGGPKRQGEGTCTRPAGWGTPHPGIGRCKLHGGSTSSHVKAAQQEQARRLLGAVWNPDAEPVTDPLAALRQLAGRLEHAADVLGSMLGGDLEPCEHCGRADVALDAPPAVAWARVLRELRQALEGMARLGIEERHVQLEQERAVLVVAAFQGALEVLARSVVLLPADRDLVVSTFLERLGPVVPGEVA